MAVAQQTARRLVRALRERRGWTQEQLAEKAGLDYKYYQLFESGHTPPPSLRLIEALARVLGAKPWVLLCDDPALVKKFTGVSLGALPEKRKPGRPPKPAKTKF
jgi:transcriptional regulator with XRE-family HTH domain